MLGQAENGRPAVRRIGPDAFEDRRPVVQGVGHGMKRQLRPVVEFPHEPDFFGFGKLGDIDHRTLLFQKAMSIISPGKMEMARAWDG